MSDRNIHWYLYLNGTSMMSMSYIRMPTFDGELGEFDQWIMMSGEEYHRVLDIWEETPVPPLTDNHSENIKITNEHMNLIRMKVRNL